MDGCKDMLEADKRTTHKPTYANKAVPQDSSGKCSSSMYVLIIPDGVYTELRYQRVTPAYQ